MDRNYKNLFQDWEIAVAKNLVNAFQETRPCLHRESSEDLLQECLFHWFFARENYDTTSKAYVTTFMGRVIRNKLTDLVREREADKRKIAHLAVSLDVPLGDDEDSSALIDEIDKNKITDSPSDPFLQMDLKIDLTQASQKLTPKQKKLYDLLYKDGLNVMEISKSLKTPRSTINDEIVRIRKIFLKEGLHKYIH